MKRRLLNLLTALSLLLCVAMLVLWVRSSRRRDGIWYTTGSARYSLHSYRGRVWAWSLAPPNYPTASVWPTPAKMGPGLVWDSAPDAWYDPFIGRGKGVRLPEDFLDAPSNGGPVGHGALGFRYVRNDAWFPRAQLRQGYPTARSVAVWAPHWALAAAAAALPAARLVRIARARRRLRRNLCPACGYDLAGNVSGVCPECGVSVVAPRTELS